MSPTPPPPRQRRTARIILLSPAREGFLINSVITRSGAAFSFWATPGGEIDAGETDLAAAERELHEELGLTLEFDGPVCARTAEYESTARTRQSRNTTNNLTPALRPARVRIARLDLGGSQGAIAPVYGQGGSRR